MSGNVLSAGQAAMVLFGGFIGLLILRVPVAFALGLACVPILLIEPRLSPMMLAQETFNAYNSFILLAVPFFLLTANLMSIGGITNRLVALSRSMVGHWPGSLAQINVVLSVFFAGISGSSTADAASQSKIFIDAQTREGYDLSFSIAITAVSAVLAVVIPPSILMIVWGGLISTSIAAMYLAGIVPGLLIAGAQMATVHVYATRRGYPTYPKASWMDMRCAIWRSIPALITPFATLSSSGLALGSILVAGTTTKTLSPPSRSMSVPTSSSSPPKTRAQKSVPALLKRAAKTSVPPMPEEMRQRVFSETAREVFKLPARSRVVESVAD